MRQAQRSPISWEFETALKSLPLTDQHPPRRRRIAAALRAYSVADPLVHFYCGEGVANCGFSRSYRGAELRLRLPRKEMPNAPVLMQRVVRLLDEHQVRPPSS